MKYRRRSQRADSATASHERNWIPVVAVGLVAFGAWLQTGLDSPIFGDRAFFTYLSQAILRGEPIYANSFMPYPPLGTMIQAASIAMGQ